jgi:hypothetical protein
VWNNTPFKHIGEAINERFKLVLGELVDEVLSYFAPGAISINST